MRYKREKRFIESPNLLDEIGSCKFDDFSFQKGGGIFGGLTDAIGLTSYGAAEDAQAAAVAASSQASAQAYAINKENLDFQKQQYADWENTFGAISDNLASYYKDLSGTKYATKQIMQLNTELQASKIQTQKELAQRGLSGSGMEAAAIVAQNQAGATQRANIRANADDIAAKEQMQFLGMGLGQGTQMLGMMSNASANTASGVQQGGGAISSIYGAAAQANLMSSLKGSQQFASSLISGGTSMGSGGSFNG